MFTTVALLIGCFAVILIAARLLTNPAAPAVRHVSCPRCGVTQIALRKPANLRQWLWGGYTCPGCGLAMDRWGKPLKP